MSEDASIRRANLNRLCTARGWTAKDLVSHLGKTYPYWRDLLSDSKKSFGEKAARKIEHGLELPRGWLDEQQSVPAMRAEESEPVYLSPSWPFVNLTFARYAKLTAADRLRVEEFAEELVRQVEVRQTKQRKSAGA